MKIEIRPSSNSSGYEVHLDQKKVNFRSETEALSFVQTLQARLASPHSLPAVSTASSEEPSAKS